MPDQPSSALAPARSSAWRFQSDLVLQRVIRYLILVVTDAAIRAGSFRLGCESAELRGRLAEARRLRREVGRGVAERRIQADPGPGDDAPTFTREELAAAWGIRD
jgi:hypothetical protein